MDIFKAADVGPHVAAVCGKVACTDPQENQVGNQCEFSLHVNSQYCSQIKVVLREFSKGHVPRKAFLLLWDDEFKLLVCPTTIALSQFCPALSRLQAAFGFCKENQCDEGKLAQLMSDLALDAPVCTAGEDC
jgi:hypothetical protein